ncbi:glutamine--fructose-6-phosphate transaminase (isomerizing) [Glycomyces algeriensis]|uniref:Glutamine--fructose-6-phosphate aminotransferase [isomerizing] n=1 Tax=Glycomyces algeriensis TaxID=256037 RepID=A0A9W6G5B9_9ACTN|nr:glutamine--fructose-6-phosphate transaminase (isomerizing) [Glycomyces algeriensis]MDA1366326.1 glutamine--fructose-6-phosphate transaminase (isomerizing) [Glycomyces algeriensis]MDR7348672.1 glucosamine--fructose-6-phosphate aminotransferase (isomerizing) [Glycomyces algeriensis]GLI41374.1 glutamine--fructose-6-phosphate aminotransferase [isomerizing] [Glycomyces algeriensis]
MCGIVGYVGARSVVDVVIDGLRRLEYRGYDSAGVALVYQPEGADPYLAFDKKAGKLANLEAVLDGQDRSLEASCGIGHTRWATHGVPSDRNAHPHLSADGRIALIHNGIIENFGQLRAELEADGVEFLSDTDTEVAAHLLGREYAADGDLTEAMTRVCARLEGAFTLLAVAADDPDTVVGARRNSPLVVGLGDGEYFLASDVAAFIAYTTDAVELGQDQIVTISRESGITVRGFDGKPSEGKPFSVDWDIAAAEKGGFETFMRKEINEQPTAVADTLRGRIDETGQIVLDEVRMSDQDFRDIDKVFIIACGTSYHAGLVTKYAIEHWTRIPCEVELASEFRYRDPVLDRSTLVVAISQSGETMDTLMAVRHAKDQKARVLSISNTVGSTIPRESDAVLYTRAGIEVAVASTKAFLTQLAACYLVGLHLAQVRGIKYADEVSAVLDELVAAPGKIAKVIENLEPVREMARQCAALGTDRVLFIGRHVGYPVALEGALKLKELAYLHAEGFAAGELKHGPISLIEDGTPVIAIVPSPRGRSLLHDKIISNIQEVKARGAKVIAICEEGDRITAAHADFVFETPASPTLLSPLLTAVPLQEFAAELATALGRDIDQPRNLAKSVTVE